MAPGSGSAVLATLLLVVPEVVVPRGQWWEFGLLILGLTKLAVWAIPIFCGYQAYKINESGGTDDGSALLWFLAACLSGGACLGWALS